VRHANECCLVPLRLSEELGRARYSNVHEKTGVRLIKVVGGHETFQKLGQGSMTAGVARREVDMTKNSLPQVCVS
jgi:hypothetical protein